jgi:hypothetical protein
MPTIFLGEVICLVLVRGILGVEGLDRRLLVVGCWLLVKNGHSKGKGEIRRFWLRQNDDSYGASPE